jgi:3-phosphoshikimate 1-carboxyvinyltransferase
MSDLTYPAELSIQPLTKMPIATVRVPGSKSITNRALVLAALASRSGACTLSGALQSEDTEVMVDCLTRLGFGIEANWPTVRVHRNDSGRVIPAKSADLFVANSGTTIRFVAAMVGLGEGTYRLDGVPRMRERPIQDLLDALEQLGVTAVSENRTGCPPIVITSNGFHGDRVSIRAGLSSQFLSGLIMAVAFMGRRLQIDTEGPVVSEPYIKMTRTLIDRWGKYWDECRIEPDASAASYFFAIPAILGGAVTVREMDRDMLQGDVKFVDALAKMGCTVAYLEDSIRVAFNPTAQTLRGIDIDMNAISDTVMTLAVVALFANGPTTIRNVAHIRHKETDRIAAVANELRKLGAVVEEREDGLTIHPKPLTGCAVDTYNDHRMAMSLALVGLKVPGVVIRNPGCVAKTYPGFWQDLEKVRVGA